MNQPATDLVHLVASGVPNYIDVSNLDEAISVKV